MLEQAVSHKYQELKVDHESQRVQAEMCALTTFTKVRHSQLS
jgi:hypothetical protein